MNICFWSNVHGQTGATCSMIAVSLYNSIVNKSKNAVMQTHYSMNNLSKSILGNKFENTVLGVGIDALMRDVKTGPITQTTANDDSVSVLNGLYSVFPETVRDNKVPYEKDLLAFYKPVINGLDPFYDNLYIDVASGYSEASMKILDNADIVVICLCQNRNVIDHYLKEPIKHKNVIYLFGNYDYQSKYNIKNLRRTYPVLKKNTCVSIAYSTNFMDSLNDGSVVEFFYRKCDVSTLSENYHFIQSVKGVVTAINMKGEILYEND